MDKKKIKFLGLFVLTVILIAFGILSKIESYITYLIFIGCILQGFMATFDYIFKLPMNVGTARILEPTEKNKVARTSLLILALALMFFAVWWSFNMPL